MIEFHLFASLMAGIVLPLMAAIESMVASAVVTSRPLALAFFAVWLALTGIDVALGHKTIRVVSRDFLFAAAAIGLLLSTDIYIQYVSDLFLTIIPNTISTVLGARNSPVAGMDDVINQAAKAAAQVYNALPGLSFKIIPLGIGVIAFVIVAIVTTAFSFGIYAVALVTNMVAIVVGPIFIALAATPATRKYFAGWLSVLVSGVTIQMLSIAVLLLLTKAETQTIMQTATTTIAADDALGELWGLAQCGALMALCMLIIKQTPALAHAIAGGIYQNVSAINGATFGAAAAAGGAAAGAARGVAGAVGQNAARQIGAGAARRMRPTIPAGQSLSKGNP
jgi:type IV secretory pathway VirB6-like protein